MKKMTDKKAAALQEDDKIVLRVSDTEVLYCSILVTILVTAGLIFLLHVEPPVTRIDYFYLITYILLGYGTVAFMLIVGFFKYTMLDSKGITAQRVFSKKYLLWKEVKFVGSVKGKGGYSTIVSAIPLPDGETYEGNYRCISTRAYIRLIADPQTIVIPDSTNERWTPLVIEMWKKYRNQPVPPTVEDFYSFPRKPRQ